MRYNIHCGQSGNDAVYTLSIHGNSPHRTKGRVGYKHILSTQERDWSMFVVGIGPHIGVTSPIHPTGIEYSNINVSHSVQRTTPMGIK